VEDVPVAVDTAADESVTKPMWLPAECDCRMRFRNWFYSDADEDTVKSLDELMGLYYYSVGRGCNLLLNIGPDRRGLLPDKDTARLLEFGAEIRRRFSEPAASLDDAVAGDDGLVFSFESPILLDHAVIREDLTAGEHIRSFAVEINPNHQKRWIRVWEGANVGHKAICRFPAVAVQRLRFTVLESDGQEKLRSLDLHYSGNA
jgi:alpha-L-fucosidase